ncbi:RNA-directed DNA polymerase, eukaryota, reverse transcriptase zinc-binding domain protein [Tanacetum coccineum]|uniref:RNA-directed DNA polymerase, eukaryota, reverse transcriptase zinc-binding domain protein n=1 Tax=Tanacetum coccineum TaxID=301880 RepID=A0ABQ5BKX0_9ASTR
MWRKFGIAEIDKWKNGCYMFKFRDDISMNAVLEKGPWMVRNKPLFVQKWSSKIGMTKVEPKKLLVWVKIVNVPLEAWCVKGISVMTNSLGKPILMDSMTAAMCHKSIGNISYARVPVEMDSEKELKNEIEIQYVDKCNNVKGNKKVQVTYDWKQPICTHCKVFRHELWNCKNGGNVNIGNKSSKDDEENKEKGVGYGGIRHDKNDEFINQGRRRQQWNDYNNRPGNYANAKNNQYSLTTKAMVLEE